MAEFVKRKEKKKQHRCRTGAGNLDFYVCYSYYDPHNNTYNNNYCNKACVLNEDVGKCWCVPFTSEVVAESDVMPKHYVGFSAYKQDARPRLEIGQRSCVED